MDGRQAAQDRLARLQDYLGVDPQNSGLIADAAETAFAAGRTDEAATLVDRYAAIGPPTPALINILGLCALEDGRYEDAVRIFRTLAADHGKSPSVAFNLAWALERSGDPEAAIGALDNLSLDDAGTLLKVRCLHQLGRLAEAIAVGDERDSGAGPSELWGVLSSVAIDAEDLVRAEAWSRRAAGDPEGEATAGMLALTSDDMDAARARFQTALSARPDFARGHLGLGAVHLHQDEPLQAAAHFDKAADVFTDHLGSWVAAGWAWLLADDEEKARRRFETALGLDDTFGETWAGLALIDLRAGRKGEARENAGRAVRLDPASPGAALARVVLASLDGAGVEAVFDRAIQGELGGQGAMIRRLLAKRVRSTPRE